MKEQLIKDLASGITGFLTHLKPQKAIKGWTPATARKKPLDKYHLFKRTKGM